MTDQKKERGAKRGTEPALVKALREEIEGLKLTIAKLEAKSQTPQEKDKEVKLPTEVWAIIAGELDQDDVNQDVLHGCGTPLRRLGNDSPGID